MKLGLFNTLVQKDTQRISVHKKSPKQSLVIDKWLFLCIIILSLFGLIMVYDASVAIAIRDFNDKYHFVRDQLRWFGIGVVGLFIFSRIDYHRLKPFVLPMLLVTLLLLLAVFIPGLGVRALGARRWINVGFFIVQPAEIAKLTLILYLSAWLSQPEKGRLLAFLLLLGMVVGLIVLEPDLGTAIIIVGIAVTLYFLSGAPVSHFLTLVPILLIGIGALALLSPYRFSRIHTFVNPDRDPLGASYQINQVLLALGSGGVTGVGIGKSRQKYEYLPEANTDSIFAIIGEEVGYMGALAVIGICVFIIWRGFRIARYAPDPFGRLTALGISLWFGIQTSINLSAMVALIPLTGIPLPLISYGGSSLIILMISFGILLNISRWKT